MEILFTNSPSIEHLAWESWVVSTPHGIHVPMDKEISFLCCEPPLTKPWIHHSEIACVAFKGHERN